MKFHQISDIGRLRETNQDSCAICQNSAGDTLLLVSDGIGGGNAGDVCSSIVKDYICESFNFIELEPGFNYFQYLRKMIEKCNVELIKASHSNPQYKGMGATLCGALITKNKTYIFNVGDSRCYRIKNKAMKCLTHDHTLLASMIESGLIDPNEGNNKYNRNILTNAMGLEKGLKIDIDSIDNDYDYLMVCSDGLYGYVEENEIKDIILTDDKLENKNKKLVDLANEKGGYDNISVVLCQMGD